MYQCACRPLRFMTDVTLQVQWVGVLGGSGRCEGIPGHSVWQLPSADCCAYSALYSVSQQGPLSPSGLRRLTPLGFA